MKKALLAPRFLLVLSLVGLAVAFYDAYVLYNGQQLWCPPPIDGCNEVAHSPYARIFDLPVGYYGVVYYLYMFLLAAVLTYDPFSRGLALAALIYSAVGVGFSLYFSYLQITYIHAFCIYCLISAITTLLLFITAITHFRAARSLN
ncbi:MAG TPA: vitamin K epoxide reductase family protein [Pseudolabrys sp.]|nr:vitamin K epoxide reductase family protein [Pseudolabrys sp.]